MLKSPENAFSLLLVISKDLYHLWSSGLNIFFNDEIIQNFKLPKTDAFFVGWQAFAINFAHAGQIGPWANPDTASQIQYEYMVPANPERHIEIDVMLKQTDIKMAGEEKILST